MAEIHDLTPWVETPSSTRVSRYRYDFATREIQVQWRNNKNDGYIYRGADYETYRSFARAVSKGKQINRDLNGLEYAPIDPEELNAPSNTRYKGLSSRVVN
jgi:hypothetical protein